MPRASPALDGQAAEGVQADEAGGRLLARRPSQRDAAAHVRHGVGQREGSRGLPHAPRGSREARPPEGGPRARPLPHAGRGQGDGVLASQGPDAVADGGKLCAPPSRCGGLHRGAHAAGPGPQVLGTVGPLGEVSRQHVRRRDGGGRSPFAEADELPGPRADLQAGAEILSRPADADGGVRRVPPLRAVGRAARTDARARVHAGRCAHLLPRGPDRERDGALHQARLLDPRRISAW